MRTFVRYYVPDAIVFITAVTQDRVPRFAAAADVDLLWRTMRAVQVIHPFRLLAYVVMPEHLHWLLRTDDEKGDFSAVMHSIKRNYTLNYKVAHRMAIPLHLWQDRFWDHVIRDADDLQRHFDYIHFNPVKHGKVTRPEAWPHSTYKHWLERGYYEPGWGSVEPKDIKQMQVE